MGWDEEPKISSRPHPIPRFERILAPSYFRDYILGISTYSGISGPGNGVHARVSPLLRGSFAPHLHPHPHGENSPLQGSPLYMEIFDTSRLVRSLKVFVKTSRQSVKEV
ncbi:hypothetical protein PIB30_031428 [Stylosanthes scabra]|uniref:Uncharacterized protein n=1 Tax=Stylosanthes scabra TaxID=79078 RepID=A0ABU6RCC5_9FABA|nr:hypothetical protein [Stylosanthes scabra]